MIYHEGTKTPRKTNIMARTVVSTNPHIFSWCLSAFVVKKGLK